jgi:2'-5' RNA ligase
MVQRNEHLVVVMLEPVPKDQEFEIWSPHITIVPWFPCDDSRRLDKTLSQVAKRHGRLSVKAGAVEEWGKKQKYPVQVIEDEGQLHELHSDVFDSLEGNGFPIHQKDFMGPKYMPHIALRNRLQRGKALKQGEQILINNFTLVKQDRLKGSGRMIKTPVKNYELS